MLVQTLPGPDGGPGQLGQLLLPRACPQAPAALPLRVLPSGGPPANVQPYAAGWLTSRELGGAHARILPGTFASSRIALRRGGTLAIDAPAATGARWSADGRVWRRVRHDDDRWTVRLAARTLPPRLWLSLRFDDGGKARYRFDVTPAGG